MNTPMMISTNTLTREEVEAAIYKAHTLRSDATWSFVHAVARKISALFTSTPSSKVSGGTGLAAS